MTLWCCGSQVFFDTIQQQVTETARLDESCEPAPNDVVLFDLDEHDQLDRIAAWTARSCAVIVALEPQGLKRGVEAVRRGARQMLLKPIVGEELRESIAACHSCERPETDVRAWRQKYAPEIIGESAALMDALEMAARAADCDCPVLITGENGTGKELLARAFHRASSRASGPFVPVNCPAIPKELVESELFGHAKGAFTGATNARTGRFMAADNGTLLLDEIGEMELRLQTKLLRVLQDYQVTRVGESRPHQVNVRVIAATNRNLEQMVMQGRFREDLYYRLNVLQVQLPSLRERPEDVPLLVDHFLQEISRQRRLPAPTLSPRVRECLASYSWPGNIRQLRNVVERLVILHRGETVELQHLPLCMVQGVRGAEASTEGSAPFTALHLPPDGIDLRNALQQFEDSMIRQALMQTNGNKNQAAKILGLNRTTLVEKLRKRVSGQN